MAAFAFADVSRFTPSTPVERAADSGVLAKTSAPASSSSASTIAIVAGALVATGGVIWWASRRRKKSRGRARRRLARYAPLMVTAAGGVLAVIGVATRAPTKKTPAASSSSSTTTPETTPVMRAAMFGLPDQAPSLPSDISGQPARLLAWLQGPFLGVDHKAQIGSVGWAYDAKGRYWEISRPDPAPVGFVDSYHLPGTGDFAPIEQNGLVFELRTGPPEHNASFLDKATEWATTTGASIVLAIVSAVNPAIGIGVALAYKGVMSLSQGAKLTDVVLSTALDYARQKAGTLAGANLYQRGLEWAQSGLSESELGAELNALSLDVAGNADLLQQAASGITLGQAQQIQQTAIDAVASGLDGYERTILETALSHGGTLLDVLMGLRGITQGARESQQAIDAATRVVTPKAASALGLV